MKHEKPDSFAYLISDFAYKCCTYIKKIMQYDLGGHLAEAPGAWPHGRSQRQVLGPNHKQLPSRIILHHQP